MRRKLKWSVLLVLSVLFVSCGKKDDTLEAAKMEEQEIVSSDVLQQPTISDNETAGVEVEVETETSKQSLEEALETETGLDILYFLYDDFDGDHKSEAFAIVGNGADAGGSFGDVTGEVWFVSTEGSERLTEQNELKIFDVFDIDGKQFIKTEECYVTEGISRLWYVDNGKAVTVQLGNAMSFEVAEDETIRVIDSTYDGSSDGTGHTYKPYWLYYENGFHEYGGVEIKQEELLNFRNADKILDEISAKGGIVSGILKRENEIININFKIPFEGTTDIYTNEYMTLQYTDQEVTKIDEEIGIYLPAYFEQIAVYPTGE